MSSVEMTSTVVVPQDRALIDGKFVGSDSGATFPVTDPATGRVLAEVPQMGEAETRRAIEAAQAAQPAWAERTARDRSKILDRWAALLTEKSEELAVLLSAENGKPLSDSRAEVAYAIGFVDFFAAEARRVYGETIPAHRTDTRILVLKQPVGVVGAITPWNFPAAMVTRKSAPAIAAGCAVVLKPAEQTPLCALAIAELAVEAGVPAGVLNIVTGDDAAAPTIGGELCANPVVRQLTFTGSTEVGRILAAQCAPTVKRMTLELGGNAAFVVFEDADLDAAVEGAITAKFRHGGQSCVGANRFFVHDAVYEDFAHRFAERAAALRVAPYTDPDSNLGPLIDTQGFEKVRAHVADALAHGARLLAGGHALEGTFHEATVLADVTIDMLISHEETFGPVAGLFRFGTEAEVIDAVNNTEYGLASYFYTRDNSRAWRVGEAIEAGMIGVNTGFISVESVPFGGVKQSGMGREGSHHGIEEFLEMKYLALGGI
ncbi:NAD-dependent succinate-semialdehyde dehydrogenase [Nocardia albiluteola]|uniref:NAD-dependent succinate-semialdehyde dehydrogenase n=1 Tax=Nocardia albiluteola TaxID=2842303 RepID=UPI001FDA5B7C|nr:NAD-dependent succinate-semialdehyde dehydrogenase [Nocardia albiluteola]